MLGSLFKSTEERKREEQRVLRRAEREAERGIEKMEEQARNLEAQQRELWGKARESIKQGKKEEAARLVQQYRMHGVLLNRVEQQKMLFKTKLLNISTAGSLKQVLSAISGVATALKLDPDKIAAELDKMSDTTDDITEINRVMEREQQRDQARMEQEIARGETVTADAELMATLEREAAAEVGGEEGVKLSTTEVNEGFDRLKSRLDQLEMKP